MAVSRRGGFTLVEMLVAITVLLILMAALFTVSAGVTNVWKSSKGKVSAFQNARSAFSTLNATLARATLNTYLDYAKVAGNVYTFRDTSNAAGFVPNKFARASELHFLSGPTTDIAASTNTSSGTAALNLGGQPGTNPGHAVFFQAPLGDTAKTDYSGLRRSMNSVGFYVQYGQPDTNLIPSWLGATAGTKNRRFRLVEFVEATENLQIYPSTARASYVLDWLGFAGPAAAGTPPRVRVLAEDVLLLLLRPRLSPADEPGAATNVGSAYDPASQLGSVLCPNYHYDSRAWMASYPMGQRVNAAANGSKRALLMMNQLPPVVDVALVCADPLSLARFDNTTTAPPSAVQVPAGLFQDSAMLETDLDTYAAQLSAARVRFHILRAAVNVQAARWSNN